MLILSLIDAAKPATCFYSGFFLLRYLVPYADDEDTLDTYIESYCENYLDDLPSRTEFVEALKDVDEDDFYNTCEEYLSSSESINIWFDPIDPLTSISQTEICDLHYILF
jgi:hypothetical protein